MITITIAHNLRSSVKDVLKVATTSNGCIIDTNNTCSGCLWFHKFKQFIRNNPPSHVESKPLY